VVAGQPFKHGELTAVMGESRLDLREAALAPGDEAVIDVVAIMGSTIVHVPADWDVSFDAVPVMGGVKDERRGRPGAVDRGEGSTGSFTGPRPRLVLRGFVLMGGLVIRS
jgi:hypothetical protein